MCIITSQKTYFISDLHLDAKSPQITAQFLVFLRNLDPQGVDAVYILGDLFEVWIGDDNLNPFNRRIINALKDATAKGIKIYFLAGNRDYLIGKKFFAETGCIEIQDETIIDLYQEKVLLMHGDSLCTLDRSYIKLRKFLRHPIIQFIYLSLPLCLRRLIASGIRQKSAKAVSNKSSMKMDVVDADVKKVMAKHNVNILIHGHTHQGTIHKFDHKERIVLAAWHDMGNAYVWEVSGERKLFYFNHLTP